LQVLTQPRDSAPLEEDAFAIDDAHHTPAIDDTVSDVQQQMLLRPPAAETNVQATNTKQLLKPARAARPKKSTSAATQQNDLRRYFPVVKGIAA
jgi:hypothetical protein